MPKVKVRGQEDLFVKRLRHPKLEAALDAREAAKESRGRAGKRFKEAHEAVTAMLGDVELGEDGVRVGAYTISRSEQGGRSVSFETGPRSVVRIKRAKE